MAQGGAVTRTISTPAALNDLSDVDTTGQAATNVLTFDGTDWGPAAPAGGGTWADWSPTLTNLTLGNGTVVARYTQSGKTVTARFKFTLGSTSAVGTSPKVSVPVAPAASYVDIYEFTATAALGDFGTAIHQGATRFDDSLTNLLLLRWNNFMHATITATTPFTWTTSDTISFTITYEAA